MQIQEKHQEFSRFQITSLGISGDKIENLERMAKRKNLVFPLACDPKGALFERLGIFRKNSWLRGPLPYPAVLVFDREGILRWKQVTPTIFRRTSPSRILDAVKTFAH